MPRLGEALPSKHDAEDELQKVFRIRFFAAAQSEPAENLRQQPSKTADDGHETRHQDIQGSPCERKVELDQALRHSHVCLGKAIGELSTSACYVAGHPLQ
jgi:hypothetical protein